MQAKQQNNVHFRTSKNENCSQKHDPVHDPAEQCHVCVHRNKYIILLRLEVMTTTKSNYRNVPFQTTPFNITYGRVTNCYFLLSF